MAEQVKTIKQFPYLAITFGILAIITAVILIFKAPNWLNYILAVFWLIIGLLGIYQGMKR